MHSHINDMDPQRVASAALQSFFNITEHWGLSREQQRSVLGSPNKTVFTQWSITKTAKNLNDDVLTRISFILGIYKALHSLFTDSTAADGWIKRPNDHPLFKGNPVMVRLTSGDERDLQLIHQYLEGNLQMPFS